MKWLKEIGQPTDEDLFLCGGCGEVFVIPDDDGEVGEEFEDFPRSEVHGVVVDGPKCDRYIFLCDCCWDERQAVEFEMRERVWR